MSIQNLRRIEILEKKVKDLEEKFKEFTIPPLISGNTITTYKSDGKTVNRVYDLVAPEDKVNPLKGLFNRRCRACSNGHLIHDSEKNIKFCSHCNLIQE